jgi:hypothetical protein
MAPTKTLLCVLTALCLLALAPTATAQPSVCHGTWTGTNTAGVCHWSESQPNGAGYEYRDCYWLLVGAHTAPICTPWHA